MSDPVNVPYFVKLTPRENEIVQVLLTQERPCQYDKMSKLLFKNTGVHSSIHSFRSMVSKAKGKLTPHGVTIEYQNGLGYYMPTKSKNTLRILCAELGDIAPPPKPKPKARFEDADGTRYELSAARMASKQNNAFVERMRKAHPEKEIV